MATPNSVSAGYDRNIVLQNRRDDLSGPHDIMLAYLSKLPKF